MGLRIFDKRVRYAPLDPNQILDEGAQTSTGGIENAITLCDILSIPLELDPPREHYMHGWGDKCLGARSITSSWTLTIQDTQGKPTSLTFDLVTGSSPLIVGNDVRKYCNTYNLENQPYLRIRRPTDDSDRYLFTYLVPEDNRSRIDIAPHPLSAKTTLLGNIHTTSARKPLAFSKRVHRYTHAPAAEMKRLCTEAGLFSKELEKAIDKVCAACEVCAKMVSRSQHGKYLSHTSTKHSTLRYKLTFFSQPFVQKNAP